MNLKESFRYQNFLDSMMRSATVSLTNPQHCLETVKTHLRSQVKSDATDETVTDEVEEFISNDDMLRFMSSMIQEREALATAIADAKAHIPFDMDAAIDGNKFRQRAAAAIETMLRNKARKSKGTELAYAFNANGDQTAYRYPVEIEQREIYDRSAAKSVLRELVAKSDEVSSAIDAATINAVVNYTPPYNVNDSFEDVVETFLAANPAPVKAN